LYLLTIEEFELAIDLLKDWRIDRFYIGNQSMFVCADCQIAVALVKSIRTVAE